MRGKITVIIFGVTLFFTYILVSAIKKQSSEKIYQDQGILLHELAFQAAHNLDRGMYERYVDILTLSNSEIIKDPLSSNDKKRGHIEFLQKYFDEYSWIGLTDLNGNVIASTQKILEGVNVSKRPWFQGGIKETFVGDVHEAVLLAKLLTNPSTDPLRFVDVATPVTNKQGKVIGTIGAHLSWHWAKTVKEDIFQDSAKTYDVDLYIVSETGDILLGDSNEGLNVLFKNLKIGQNTESYFKNDKYLIGQHQTKGHKSYPGLGWTVITVQELEKSMAPAEELGKKVSIYGFLFAIVLSSLFLYVSRSIFKPFYILSEIAKKVNSGENAEWPILTNHEEAQTLSHSLSDLSKNVREKNKQLINLNDSLISLVDERTAELSIAKAKAESASDAKSLFLATMSHEIRTPIHGIMGMSQVLIETNLNKDQERYATSIFSASNNLLRIVNDILDYSKIEAGKMTLEEAEFDLVKLAEDIIDSMSYLVKNKELNLKLNTDHLKQSQYIGDATRIRQILVNLIGNAIKFTWEGYVELKISIVENYENGMTKIHFDIIDSGIGMSEESLCRLFTNFTQADASIARKFGGSGLGLSITKQLVNLMEGEIGVKSEQNIGSTFYFDIKLRNKTTVQNPSIRLTEEIKFYPNARVLVVDDDGDNRVIAIKALEKIAGHIETAENGLLALKKLDEGHFDLILMDCRMPEMNGFEATEAIRNSSKPYKNITIIAMTADATNEEKEACLMAGMNSFLSKPIEFKKLRKVVSSYLDQFSNALE